MTLRRWEERIHYPSPIYESHARLTACSIWSVWCFQENISRSKRNQSCSDWGGGMCGWTKEFFQKGMASFHNAVLVGGDEKRFSASNSPFLICVQTLFPLNTAFVSSCNPNVKWEEGVGAVTNMLPYFHVQGWETSRIKETRRMIFFFSLWWTSSLQESTKTVWANQNTVTESAKQTSEVETFATVSEMSNVQKEKKILCVKMFVLLYFPVPNINSVSTSFKPIHAVWVTNPVTCQ